MNGIQSSIGNINSFEIHVDPIDNYVARIIDVNYTGDDKAADLFQLQVHNTRSTVRSYSLQSQIFPNQSSIIAIGSQAKGGQLGIQNNTMIDFNKEIKDRIIPKKTAGKTDDLDDNNFIVTNSIASIIQLLAVLNSTEPAAVADISNLIAKAKNSLRDIIIYFQTIFDSDGGRRNIIPIQFSFEMDGIGGLIIGNLFRINQDILPKGYKGKTLAQTVTRIAHTLQNNDWTTKIDALNIILDKKRGKFEIGDITSILRQALKNAIDRALPSITSVGGVNAPIGVKLSYSGFTPFPAPKTDIIRDTYEPALNKAFPDFSRGLKTLMAAQVQLEGFKPGTVAYRTNNPGNVSTDTSQSPPKITTFPTLEDGIKAQWNRVLKGALNNTSKIYTSNMTLYDYLYRYAPPPANNPTSYTNFVINYFKTNASIDITATTTLEQINAIK